MIESKELRIGNYVMIDFESQEIVKVKEIKEITEGKKGNMSISHVMKDGGYATTSLEESIKQNEYDFLVKPIPLTEDWLVKFGYVGFKKGSYKTYGLIIDNVISYSVNIHNNEVVFPNKYKPVKLKYVHQLQNLYHALTGEELTIKQ